MKKLKVFALALVAALGFSACNSEDEATYKESTIVMGGSASTYGSFYTFDNGVQTKSQLGNVATNVVFCFQTIDTTQIQFISGTVATNAIVSAQASETKFAEIGSAKASKFEALTDADFTSTSISLSSKIEAGRNAVAFSNANCKGFFEVEDYNAITQDITLKVWIQE